MAKACILRNLDNPMLSGLSIGLRFSQNNALELNPAMFPCCAAQGAAWDQKLNALHSCQLKSRLARLADLMARFRKTYPKAVKNPTQISPEASHNILIELAGVFKHDKHPATLSYSNQRFQPSILWSKAFAAVWRYGMDVRIARLKAFDPVQVSYLTAPSDRPYALFIDQVEDLWDPIMAETVEHIVQQAYNAQAFLWIEFFNEDTRTDRSPSVTNLKEAYSKRIKKLKDQHPLDQLSRDCISRLQSMSGVIHRIEE